MDINDDNTLGAIGTERGLALALAVIHHGFSCFSTGSVPAAARTVLHTAKVFEAHLLGQEPNL